MDLLKTLRYHEQIAQNKAARLVLGCSSRSSVADMHVHLNWLYVEERLSTNLLIIFYKVIQTQNPIFIFDKIIHSSAVQMHSTRGASSGRMTLPRAKSNKMKKVVAYRAKQVWNCLPSGIRDIKGETKF